MDPNATLARFMDSKHEYELSGLDKEKASEYMEEMKEVHEDLTAWFKNGGFEPDWNKHGISREEFYNFFSGENSPIDE